MSFQFNADEILAMAEQIELNGASFYRRAARIVKEAEVSKLLQELAAWEEVHQQVFASMRQNLKEGEGKPSTFDPEDETLLYLKAMADGHVFDVRTNPADRFTGEESAKDILLMAIGQEKDSIVFYLGLKDMVSQIMGKDRIDEIIREEMRHIGFLNKEIVALGGGL